MTGVGHDVVCFTTHIQTYLATNKVVTSCMNIDNWLDKITRESCHTWDLVTYCNTSLPWLVKCTTCTDFVAKEELLSTFRVVIKSRGPGIFPGYQESGPRLLLLENRRKIEPKEIPSHLIPRLLVVFTRQLEILVTTLYFLRKLGGIHHHFCLVCP